MTGEAAPDSTLAEDTPTGDFSSGLARTWLIYVGSSENAFADAGAIFPLQDVRSVRFGRGNGDRLASDVVGGVLHVALPLGWVNSAHAELRALTTSSTVEFDVRDLGSRNGTHIEGHPVSGVARLRPGEVFEIGRAFFTVRAVEARDLPAATVALDDAVSSCNPRLCATYRRLRALAESAVPLLLRGETGTGKEMTVRAIHALSKRTGPLVVGNLSALGPDAVDAALFGNGSRGPGLFSAAAGGTLFLDELGELTTEAQAKLLNALSEQQIQAKPESSVRLVCATLHDMHGLVQSGRFRADLYSRVAGYEARIPPLRARREDLGLLTSRLIQTTRQGTRPRLATRAFRRLLEYGWPYNVRELGQTLATASILAGSGGEITRDVIDEILERRKDMPQTPDSVHELRARLVAQLVAHRGDTSAVAQAMQRDVKDVQRWLERFELHPELFAGALAPSPD